MTFPKITIYTDGACEPNPGPGGWAAVILDGARTKKISGFEDRTTNNRMELTAAVRAFQAVTTPSQVEIFTDSQYLMLGITQWLQKWIRRGWRTTSGKVANQDLWQALVDAVQPHQVTWRWLRGHTGDRYNEMTDQLARRAMQNRSGSDY
jgi:ribonuclease HI